MLLWGSEDDCVVVPSIAAIAGSMSTILLTNYYFNQINLIEFQLLQLFLDYACLTVSSR